MLPGPGRIQSVRGPHGKLGPAYSRVVHIAIGDYWQPLRRDCDSHFAFSSHRFEIPHVQPGGCRSVYRHSSSANRRRRRVLHWSVFQLRY